MKKTIIVTVLCAAAFIPASIVGWINRPQPVEAVVTQPTLDAQPAYATWESVASKASPNIVIPIKIYGTPRAKKPAETPTKEFVCRPLTMLNGGVVQHCDWI